MKQRMCVVRAFLSVSLVFFGAASAGLGCSDATDPGASLDASQGTPSPDATSDEPDAGSTEDTATADGSSPDTTTAPDAGPEPDAAETPPDLSEPDAGPPPPKCEEGECSDDNPCTDDSCDPAVGCIFTDNTEPCDDWDACTADDTCAAGSCVGGEAPVCDDSDPCTPDFCESATGCVAGEALVCDDGNPCTTDACDGEGGCTTDVITSTGCRPRISVDFPPRAATLTGEPALTVTGTVWTGAGSIEWLTLNQLAVEVAEDGTFAMPYSALSGGNTLVFNTADSHGRERKRVQAFNWSPEYLAADELADPGMGLWLGKTVIDDGDHDLENINDLATLFESLLVGIDLAGLIPSPAATDVEVIVGVVYDIYINNLSYPPAVVTVTPMVGGMHLNVTITGATADLLAIKKSGFLAPGEVTGLMTIDSIVIDADILLGVNNETGDVIATLDETVVAIEGVSVDIDGLLLSLLEGIINGVIGDFISDIETEFVTAIGELVGPLLEDVLGALAFNLSFDLDAIDPTAAPISVQLQSGFSAIEFNEEGGEILLATGVQGGEKTVVYEPLGAARRYGCGTGTIPMVMPAQAPLEIAVHDDVISLLLLALWEGGFMEFPVSDELLGGVDPSQFGITDLVVDLSAMLPPSISDCYGEQLTLHIGDLRADATLSLAGMPMTVEMYASFTANLTIITANEELGLTLSEIQDTQIEVTILEDDAIAFESVVANLIQDNLVPSLLDSLAGGALGGIPLPTIDLSGLAGLPEGSALTIDPQETYRLPGVTVISGGLK
ncbi:MAG: hypothetical protein ACI9WU_002461 [Myxococcota bacterium]|jgi:hypothetical protein